uniref:Uncharacterized protein n=1 Tax=Anopheles maculatus TaxID=74869 RepID=A0A182S5R0_9DIPT
MVRYAMRTFVRYRLVVLLVLLVTLDEGAATIDNATGAVRENSLPSEVPAIVIDQSSVAPEATVPDTGRMSVSTSTIATDTITTTTAITNTIVSTSEVAPTTTSSISISNEATRTVTTTTTTTAPIPATEVSPIEPIHQQHSTSADELPPNCSEFSVSTYQLRHHGGTFHYHDLP